MAGPHASDGIDADDDPANMLAAKSDDLAEGPGLFLCVRIVLRVFVFSGSHHVAQKLRKWKMRLV